MKLSDNLKEYYDSISKAVLACENIVAKIKEKIDATDIHKNEIHHLNILKI